MKLAALTAALTLTAAITAVAAHADPTTLADLAKLPVHDPAPMTGYSRDQFGPAWTDNNDDQFGHNHCDTRDDILARDLENVVRQGNCTVVSGILHDPYTGKVIHFERGPQSAAVQIDHIVALGNAWITGAQRLSPQQRIDLANDPRNLLAVDGPANNNKRDKAADQWLPPNAAFRCEYVADQVEVKTIYHLWVTRDEKRAMVAAGLASCLEGK